MPRSSLQYFPNLAKLFTSAFIKEMSGGYSVRWYEKIQDLHAERPSKAQGGMSVKQFLANSYRRIRDNYPSEYVYKNEILHQLVLKNHQLSETVLFEEFPCYSSQADLLVVNGKSTVYEIKTELDTLNRLSEQIRSYTQVFECVNVVTASKNVSKIRSQLPEASVGIIVYDSDQRSFTVDREASPNTALLAPEKIFGTLRMEEYKKVILSEFGFLPEVNNTQIYRACEALFTTLPIQKQIDHVKDALKRRTLSQGQVNLFKSLPSALSGLLLTRRFSKPQCINLDQAMQMEL
jgi:hypothetical protein